MPQTIEELNRRFGTTGVQQVAPAAGGRVPTISELNIYHEKKRKEEEERQRKQEEERRVTEDRMRKAEERIKQKDEQLKAQQKPEQQPEPQKDVLKEQTTIKQATDKQAKPGFWDNVKQFFGFKQEGIKSELIEQEKAREEIKKQKRKQELAQIRKEASAPSEYIIERLEQGSLSQVGVDLPAAGSVIAKKVGATKIAEKLDITSRENKKLLEAFTQEYLLEDRYDVVEKMKAMPVRTAIGMIAQTAPSIAAALTGVAVGGALAIGGATAATVTTVSVGTSMAIGSLFNFGSAYSDARDFTGENGEKLGEEEAEKIGFWVALLSAPIDAIPEARLVGKVGGKPFLNNLIRKAYVKNITEEVLNRVGRSASSLGIQASIEGVGESGQTIIENAWAKTYDKNRSLFEGTSESFLAGFLLVA